VRRRDLLTAMLTGMLLASGRREGQAASPPLPPPKPGGAVIVLDPGHGGRDPGAIGRGGTREKDVTLATCLAIRDQMAGSDLAVILTRDSDHFLSLTERVEIAHQHRADLFVSIHADAAPNLRARGLSAYTLSEEASDSLAKAIAEQENAVDDLYGLDLSDTDQHTAAILLDLALRIAREDSRRAQRHIVQGVASDWPLLDNPRRSANFAVLRSGEIPSVLVETGFLSNPEDERLLADPAGRRRVATALAREIAVISRTFWSERTGRS